MLARAAIAQHIWHWRQALMGPVVTIGLLFYQQWRGKSPTWGLFGTIIFSGLAWQFYTELRKARAEMHSHEYPKLYLRYDLRHDTSVEYSGFFVQVEGEKGAFDVSISSEPVMGQNHKRIAMQWQVPTVPIGTTAIPIRAYCVYYQGSTPHQFSGSSGQIHNFFEQKKDFPNELEVTLAYKDVDGHLCPARKVKITSSRDLRGNFEIGCIPIESQAASRT